MTINNADKEYTVYAAKCSSCIHSDVCRYQENYYKILREIERTINEKSYDNMFKLSLNCDHYKANPTIGIYNNCNTRVAPSYTINDFTNKDNIYKTTVGDSVIKQSNL